MRSAIAVIIAIVVVAAVAAIVAAVGFGFPTPGGRHARGHPPRPAEFRADRARAISGRRLGLRRVPQRSGHEQTLRRRAVDRDAVRQGRRGQYHAGSRHRDRRMERHGVHRGASRRQEPAWLAALPGDALSLLHEALAGATRSRSAPISTRFRRSAIASFPISFHSRSTSARRCWSGTRSTSTPASSSPIRRSPAEWNRGAYLVQGPGHCGACHTPKSKLGGDDDTRALQGDQLQGWFAPNITGDPVNGVGGWSVDDIAAYLKSGHNATTAATGLMAEVVTFSGSALSGRRSQGDRDLPEEPAGPDQLRRRARRFGSRG